MINIDEMEVEIVNSPNPEAFQMALRRPPIPPMHHLGSVLVNVLHRYPLSLSSTPHSLKHFIVTSAPFLRRILTSSRSLRTFYHILLEHRQHNFHLEMQ